MSDDRRTSVRRQALLPFAWRALPDDASTADAIRALDLPAPLALQSRLAELDEELRRTTAALPDHRVLDALRALDAKVSVLEEAIFATVPTPAPAPVTLSADGVGFTAAEALAIGSRVAVHLVLPVAQHVIGLGCVRHCSAEPQGYGIGVELLELDAQAARRLTRYAIGGRRDTD
ncbi:MAG TPA: PilZ domain-containing protein [Pseudomonadales bacterium]